jgi:hypothetical protein
MKARRVGNAIFCDDIRREVGNKLSLIGTYDAEMVFSARPPLVVPKLACFISIISEVDDPAQNIIIRVIIPSGVAEGTEIIRHETKISGTPKYMEGAVSLTFRSFIEMQQVVITHPGFIEVWADADDDTFRCGRVLVTFSDESQES